MTCNYYAMYVKYVQADNVFIQKYNNHVASQHFHTYCQ